MSGRWEQVGPGRSVWRPEPPGGWIGPDALEPYLSEGSRAAAEVARGIAERWQERLGSGRSHGERRARAAEVFGDPLPRAPERRPRPVVDQGPVMWDRMLVDPDKFRRMAEGVRTFAFWVGGNVPRRDDVVVFVEHQAYRDPSPFGPSCAFVLGDVQETDWVHGRAVGHVASLLPLPGIVRAPDWAGTPWGFWCHSCGAWPAPSPCYRFVDQSQALMAAAEARFVVTTMGLLCSSCDVNAVQVRRGRIGYEVEERAGAGS